jgi:uncharacterized membrane protein YtjA (UPF0391 family)
MTLATRARRANDGGEAAATEESTVVYWLLLIFVILTVAAGVFAFTSLGVGTGGVLKILFFVLLAFCLAFALAAVMRWRRWRKAREIVERKSQ